MQVSLLDSDGELTRSHWQNINHLAWENTMKTMELCFEDWQSKMRRSGRREVKIDSVVQLTLKVSLI